LITIVFLLKINDYFSNKNVTWHSSIVYTLYNSDLFFLFTSNLSQVVIVVNRKCRRLIAGSCGHKYVMLSWASCVRNILFILLPWCLYTSNGSVMQASCTPKMLQDQRAFSVYNYCNCSCINCKMTVYTFAHSILVYN